MIAQDSDDPTGVSHDGRGGRTAASRARLRKSNAAIQMRLAGATWSEIAVALGYPTGRQALVAVEKALEKELKSQGDREEIRRLAGARLERMLRSIWEKAVDPGHPEQLAAQARAQAIVTEHAKLFGAYAPAEVVVHSPTLNELEGWVSAVLAVKSPRLVEADIIAGEVTDGAVPTGT